MQGANASNLHVIKTGIRMQGADASNLHTRNGQEGLEQVWTRISRLDKPIKGRGKIHKSRVIQGLYLSRGTSELDLTRAKVR